MIKASEPVVSVILGLIVNGIVPKPFTAASLLPITYGVAYASTLGQLDVKTMSRELTTKAAKYVHHLYLYPMTIDVTWSGSTHLQVHPDMSRVIFY